MRNPLKSFRPNGRRGLHNERGSLLIISYMIIFMLVAFGGAAVILSINDSKVSQRQKRTMEAFHIAEAGIERAIYDLRTDFLNDSSSPSWSDGTINTFTIGPNTGSFYSIPYASTSLNSGSYAVTVKNVTGVNDSIWVRSTGTLGDISQTIEVYAKIESLSPWDNAIFAGSGAAGAMVNGNVNISGSVHILGSGLTSSDYAIDLGGTAELVRNNYSSMEAGLFAKVPTLPTTVVNGETVYTLSSELRIKHGKVGLSGSSTVGEPNVAGNSWKEFVDATYVTDGYGGNQGTNSVYSDNGWSNSYDLGDSVSFPSLSDPYSGYATYQSYLRANALVLNSAAQLTQLASITPTSSFTYSGANGSISMDGAGHMTVSGVVYIEGGDLNLNKAGANKTINYTGAGSILVTGNANINVNLETTGNSSFPNDIVGIMTPGNMTFNEANINIMGLFYAEGRITAQKQTDIIGTIVSNYFDFGTNVPAIFQVPETVNHLPSGMIGQSGAWVMRIVSWQKL